jgi:hypothetical protein
VSKRINPFISYEHASKALCFSRSTENSRISVIRVFIPNARVQIANYDRERIVLDMDSSASPTNGEQENSVWNGHFGCTCYHPLFVYSYCRTEAEVIVFDGGQRLSAAVSVDWLKHNE